MNQKRRDGLLADCGSEASPLSAEVWTVAARASFFAAISGASLHGLFARFFPKANVTTAKNPL